LPTPRKAGRYVAAGKNDADEKVKSFAQEYIASLDRQIAAEQRRSEEEIEMRKRRYEEPDKGEEK
jgi:hypothetical protein